MASNAYKLSLGGHILPELYGDSEITIFPKSNPRAAESTKPERYQYISSLPFVFVIASHVVSYPGVPN